MSKTLAKVAVIAGAVALVATGVGAAAGASLAAAGISTASIATFATLAAGVASIGAQLTAKKPPARGSVNSVTIATDALAPYLIGRTYFGGVLRHDAGYGATLNKVKNPYRGMVIEYSVAGPLEELVALTLDFAPVTFSSGAATGYYAGFLWRDFKLGATPETALTPNFSGFPNWTSAHKLSGKAAVLWNLKFDRDGKRFASGVPVQGAIWKGVKVYDPRLDSTYPGGSGAQRINDETTWTWSENPGLHGLGYALGRYRNGKKVFGVGLPAAGLILPHFVELANVCDANGWKAGGVLFEPGDRWANLKDILAAGGATPLFAGGKLGLRINAPRVALDTITDADLADGDVELGGMKSWRERRNGLVPKYRSEANKWDYVQSDLVSVTAYVTADGEQKIEERQFNLVQAKDQAAQLAGYELVNGRERGPWILPCKPRLRRYGPGDQLTLALPSLDLTGVDAVVTGREVDPATMVVTLTLEEETPGKHATVLALTGTAPPAPNLPSPADRDDISSAIATDASAEALLIQNSYPVGLSISATDAGSDATITTSAHTRRYPDKDVAIGAHNFTGLAYSTDYWLAVDDDGRDGASLTWIATTTQSAAYLSAANPARHFLGFVTTPVAGGGSTGGEGGEPPGGGGPLP